MALGQFDLGPAAAFSLMYFLVILLVSWVFYTVMTNLDKREELSDDRPRRCPDFPAICASVAEVPRPGQRLCRGDDALSRVPAAADLLARQHEPADQPEILGSFSLWPQNPTLATTGRS
jgi:hypothetical protein